MARTNEAEPLVTTEAKLLARPHGMIMCGTILLLGRH